ncbi:MAG: TonB family protein [Tannerella sp.]|jgi:TonB family protein|nr:TonB family protein [Tannerella sp.]
MKFNKDDISALITTILVHLAILLLLYFSVLRTIIPSEDSGILVTFGNVFAAVGTFEPQYTASVPVPQREAPPQVTASVPPRETSPKVQSKPAAPKAEELITQDKEETVSVPDSKNKKEENRVADEKARREREEAERRRQEENDRKRREEEERKRQEELRKQQEAISSRVSNAFGQASSQQSRQKDTGDAPAGAGNQGSPFGNSDTGAKQGTGGFGTFNLDGRYIGQGGLPRPTDRGQEEGKIVINITVDPNGNVILAEIGKGTNIDNALMRNSALEAAKRAKFNKIKGTNNQNGTITYIYKLT